MVPGPKELAVAAPAGRPASLVVAGVMVGQGL